MLLLERSAQSTIFIGDDIVVSVNKIYWRRGQLRCQLGVSAPPNVKILRDDAGVLEAHAKIKPKEPGVVA